jgi:exopolyphosphatase/guanosine-5'-triphosphate,3'-diphosphate pyrophosphatase
MERYLRRSENIMDKHAGRIAAAIDIGSSGVRMQISQWDGQGIVKLDRLEKPTNMGQEVFGGGHISSDTVRALSGILAGFSAVAKEYQINRIHTVATTALREAVNQAYVLDYLAIQNKLDVHVMEDSEANALLFNAMKNSAYPSRKKAMLVYSGAGTMDFALLENGQVTTTHGISAGLLKIAEMMREATDYSRHIDVAAEEYLRIFLTRDHSMHKLLQAEGIVFGARNMQPLYKLCGDSCLPGLNDVALLQRKTLLGIYEQYRRLSIDQICARHKISAAAGGVLYATLTLLALLLQMTAVEEIYCTQISLADAVLNLDLRPGARRAYSASLRSGAISSALELSARYRCDLKHALYVAALALTLFDKLRKVHGLSGQQSLLLQTACILHETGYYTTAANLEEASYDLVKDAQIYGLRYHETLLSANIISPQSLPGAARGAWRDPYLSEEDMLFINKMHAILHLADALDCSRKQKAGLCQVEIADEQLLLTLKVQEDYSLEQWMFGQSAKLFREVFGLMPRLKIRNEHGIEGGL